MKVVGFAGQMRSGKNVAADYLAEQIGWSRYAFATGVKEIYCDAFGVDLEFIEKWKVIPEPPPGFKMSCREGLQFIGDGFRKIVPTIWVDKCFRTLTENNKPTVLSDVRYVNELEMIKSAKDFGLTVLLWRPGMENDDPNGSEAQIRPFMEWCRDTGHEGWICDWEDSGDAMQDCPKSMKEIDVFLRNEGSISQLFEKIDKYIVPVISGCEECKGTYGGHTRTCSRFPGY